MCVYALDFRHTRLPSLRANMKSRQNPSKTLLPWQSPDPILLNLLLLKSFKLPIKKWVLTCLCVCTISSLIALWTYLDSPAFLHLNFLFCWHVVQSYSCTIWIAALATCPGAVKMCPAKAAYGRSYWLSDLMEPLGVEKSQKQELVIDGFIASVYKVPGR